jgi:AP-1 complex subunit gamma-1
VDLTNLVHQAGNYVKEQILSSFVRLIATTPDLQTYSVQKLYAALKEDITQEGLTLAGSWVIGEYGDALLRGGQYEEEELVKEVKESDIVDLFETILGSSYAGLIVQQYIVTASMKLTTRLSDPAQIERLRRLLQRYSANLDVEIQQRAAEYGNLFGHDQIRRGVLEKMPPPEIREESRVLGEATKKRQSKIAKKKPAQAATEDLLLDLMGDAGPSNSMNGAANGTQQSQDLLADIMGGSSSPPQTSSPAPQSNVANIMDLFNSGPSTSPAPAQPRAPPQGNSMDLLGVSVACRRHHHKLQRLQWLLVHLRIQHTTRMIYRSRSSLSVTPTLCNSSHASAILEASVSYQV